MGMAADDYSELSKWISDSDAQDSWALSGRIAPGILEYLFPGYQLDIYLSYSLDKTTE